MHASRIRTTFLVNLAAVIISIAPAPRVLADPPDPMLPVLNRMSAFFEREELDGITHDARYALNPTETIRLSVVSQLLAYNELYFTLPNNGVMYDNVRMRADFLLAHLGEIRSRSPFDGMLAYALLDAYEITGDPRLFTAGEQIVRDVMRFSGFSNTLNWGLMAAMGIAKYHDLTGNVGARAKTNEIVNSLRFYQHPDGSFPHYCPGSVDIHYTGWMGMELIHVRRYVPSPMLDQTLSRIADFLAARVLPGGDTQYEEPCNTFPGCRKYYDSIRSGCGIDYDTRGWINELGYTGLVMDDRSRLPYHEVMGMLYDLEDHGGFRDKWAYPPPSYDPIYPWATGDPSVIRTSVVFWSLATMYRERHAPRPRHLDHPRVQAAPDQVAHLDDTEAPAEAEVAMDQPWRFLEWNTVDRLVLEGADPAVVCAAQPEPEEPLRRPRLRETSLGRPGALSAGIVRVASEVGRSAIRFALSRDARVSLAIHDLAGRRVRELKGGVRAAGAHEAVWDGRDASGAMRSAGIYFARLTAEPGGEWTTRVLLRR